MKKDLIKIHYQQEAQLNNSDQKIYFIFGEKNNSHPIRNAYLQYDITMEKVALFAPSCDPPNPLNHDFVDAIRLINKAFAFTFKDASLGKTAGSDLEHENCFGQFSNFVSVLTGRDRYLLKHFDNNNETEAGIPASSLNFFFDNHGEDANKGKIKGHIPLQYIFRFCKTFKN